MKLLIALFPATILCLLFIYGTADNYDTHNIQNKVCECIDYNCGCCVQLNVEVTNGKLCSNFSYLPKEYGISATLTYNKLTILNETISATNPPALCAFYFKEVKMNVCLRLYNLNYTDCFSGCLELEVDFFHVLPLKRIELGHFGCRHSNCSASNDTSKLHHERQPEVVLIWQVLDFCSLRQITDLGGSS